MKNHSLTIRTKDLKVTFFSEGALIKAIRGVSISFEPNKITGIIGESGCGKSVLAMSLLRMLPANCHVNGNITYGDEELLTIPLGRLRKLRARQIALIPQSPGSSLNPLHRLYRQVAEGYRVLKREGWIGKGNDQKNPSIKKVVERLFSDLGLDSLQRHYPFQLSGGMRQRVLASIALIREPSWMIADEPTKGLDPHLRRAVSDLLKYVTQNSRAGLIVISHDIPFTRQLCDEIAVMYAGQIVEKGTTRQILEQPVHPYTKGLIASLPEFGLQAMPGNSPSMGSTFVGCAFHDRCSSRVPSCAEQEPPEVILNGRTVKCFLY